MFLSGAGNWNDDVTGSGGPSEAEKRGYVGGGAHGINNNFTGPTGPANLWSPQGQGEDVVNGYKQAGTSAYDKDVDRYRTRGAQGQAPITLDQGQANESRGLQMGALGLMGSAARGEAPSRAAAIGQMTTDAAIRGQAAGLASARGPGASVAAIRGAQVGAGQQMGAANAQVADMRAKEMAAAQQGYAHATQGVQGQDIQAATANAQFDAQQRALNEQHQQANERLAFDTRHAQMQNANEFIGQQQQAELNRRRQRAVSDAEDRAAITQDANLVLGLGTGLLSDERTKTCVVPMGSLAHFARR